MNYETVLILDPQLDDAAREAEIEKAASVIKKNGEIKNINKWGKRKLAYVIKKRHHGDYTVFTYTGNGAAVNELESGFRINENVLRFLTVRL